jgi:hypothetical protein
MLTLDTHLFLRISQLENGPRPLPLESGFTLNTSYRALGMFNPSETSDAYFILSNDRDEIWFICNRHLRTVAALPESNEFRIPLESAIATSMRDEIGTHTH